MAMKMLASGGVQLLTDGLRTADDSNPEGYYEFERVKELDKSGDLSWLNDARGKAVKIISHLLPHLPDNFNYRVIFMRRDLTEVVSSQNAMLTVRGAATGDDDGRTTALLQEHLRDVERLLSNRACFRTIQLQHGQVLRAPLEQAKRVNDFLGGELDVERMAAAVDKRLYRNRAAP